MNQRDNNPMTVQRSLRLSEDLYQWVEKLAKETKRKPSEVIRLALEHLKENNWKP